jgi:hypothetical protein
MSGGDELLFRIFGHAHFLCLHFGPAEGCCIVRAMTQNVHMAHVEGCLAGTLDAADDGVTVGLETRNI